jgi:hypothetical protein
MKEMANNSLMKSYLDKNNLHYFTVFLNSVRPIKAVIRHLPPDTPAEDISNGLESSDFIIINVRKMKANKRAPNEQTHMNLLLLFLVKLTRNIFKLNSLNDFVI